MLVQQKNITVCETNYTYHLQIHHYQALEQVMNENFTQYTAI